MGAPGATEVCGAVLICPPARPDTPAPAASAHGRATPRSRPPRAGPSATSGSRHQHRGIAVEVRRREEDAGLVREQRLLRDQVLDPRTENRPVGRRRRPAPRGRSSGAAAPRRTASSGPSTPGCRRRWVPSSASGRARARRLTSFQVASDAPPDATHVRSEPLLWPRSMHERDMGLHRGWSRAAGLSAAVVLGRARRRTLVIDAAEQSKPGRPRDRRHCSARTAVRRPTSTRRAAPRSMPTRR
jgi:hypothetical protein